MQKPPLSGQIPPLGDGGVVFDRESAKRIEESVKYVEQILRNRPRLPEGGGGGLIWLRKAKTGGSGIPAAVSDSQPSSATVTFCDLVSGIWTPNGVTALAYNASPAGPVAANKVITVGWVGIWEVSLEPCP